MEARGPPTYIRLLFQRDQPAEVEGGTMTCCDAWRRVTRSRPCPVCGRPDWCLVAADGSAAICPRIPSDRRLGDAGWLHRLQDDVRPRGRQIGLRADERPEVDLGALHAGYRDAVDRDELAGLATGLGVSPVSLERLGIGWVGWGWTFPMHDGEKIVGIRVRKRDGSKLAIKGGHDGLFIPDSLDGSDGTPEVINRLLIAEGPTDTAALLDLDFAVIGRPSCAGGTTMIIRFMKRYRPAEVVIVADGDVPGQRGAGALTNALLAHVPVVRVTTPPGGIKDARAWKAAGATREEIENTIEAAAARRLTVQVRGLKHGS